MPHTETPWTLVREPAAFALGGYRIVGADHTTVGYILGGLSEEGEENARLAVAAPVIYSALKAAYDHLDLTFAPCDPGCDCLLHSLKAALNQVEPLCRK